VRAALAWLGPLVVLGLGAHAIWSAQDEQDLRAQRNAGTVVGGVRREEGSADWIRARMAERSPAVLIIGDSLANTDIDEVALASTLGMRPDRIVRISLPASIGAHWYAALDNHVYGAGHRPKLLVVVAALRSMLETSPPSEAIRENLEALLDGDDPVIRARLREGSPSLALLRANRVKLRRQWLDRLTALPVGLLWAPRGAVPRAWGADRIERATASVFDRRELDLGLWRDLLPTAIDPRVFGQSDPAALPSPQASFLPEILRLAREHGSEVAIVRPPLSPLMPAEARDVVLPGVVEQVDEMARAHGGRLLDLAELDLGVHLYRDLAHLGPAGADRFSRLLGQWIPRARSEPAPHAGIHAEPAFRVPPPALALGPPRPGAARTWFWDIPQVAPVLDTLVAAGVPLPAGCVPVQVTVEGEPLQPMRCSELLPGRQSGRCFDGSRLYARASARFGPDDLVVSPDPERRCGPFLWLYPEDEVEIPTTGAGHWTVTAFGDEPPQLRLGGESWQADGPLGTWQGSGPVTISNERKRNLVLLTEVAVSPAE
jgi:hypothetical protein